MANWLQANYAGSWSDSISGSAYNVALPFTAAAGGQISAVRWYRVSTSGSAPSELSIWDTVTQSQVWATSVSEPVPDNGTVGWQSLTLANPITLTQGREYRVAWLAATGFHQPYQASGLPTPVAGCSWTSSWRRYAQNANPTYPNTGDTQWVMGIDAYLDPFGAPPPSPYVTVADLTNALTAWFADTGDNTHRWDDTVPNVADVVRYQVGDVQASVSDDLAGWASTVGGDVSSILTSVGSGLGTAVSSIGGDVSSILTSVGSGLGSAVATVQDTLSHASTGMVDVLNNVSSVVSTILNDASSGLVAVLNRLTTGGGALPPQLPPPATGWAMVAETDFTTELAWAQEADMYVFSFTTPPSNATANVVDGVTWLGHMLWWAPLNGTLVGERRFLDFPSGYLYENARRLPGILIKCNGYAEGHVQAWQYTAP